MFIVMSTSHPFIPLQNMRFDDCDTRTQSARKSHLGWRLRLSDHKVSTTVNITVDFCVCDRLQLLRCLGWTRCYANCVVCNFNWTSLWSAFIEMDETAVWGMCGLWFSLVHLEH